MIGGAGTRRLAIVAAWAAALVSIVGDAGAFVVANRRPGGRLVMNTNMGTTPRAFIAGTSSWNETLEGAMHAWNQAGIGPGLDHNFFQIRVPLVNGDPCEVDAINEVRFSSTNCGSAFGTALALTRSWSQSGVVIEADLIFDTGRAWNVYTGNLRPASAGGTLQDLYRVAVHEFGHAAGLDHPDDHGQAVDAIMNSRISHIDRLQADDIAGGRAIAWGSAPPPSSSRLDISKSGSGTGLVASSPSGIFCGTTCSASFAGGTAVTLTATPDSGSRFAGWAANTGTDCGSGPVIMSTHRQCTAIFERNPAGPLVRTVGARGIVTRTATLYGGFTLASGAHVMIAVRGPSLQTLGITQDPLDSPTLRLYDANGNDILLGPGGARGATSCSSGSGTAAFYARGTPLHSRDSCDGRNLGAGVYSFTVTPSADAAGEALFEVLLNAESSGSAPLSTIGSRGTVTRSATLFGGFTLASPATVEIAVRGPSLQTLGIAQDPLDSPRLRIYNAAGTDILFNTGGGAGVSACSPTHPTAARYAQAGQPLSERDACASLGLPSGTFTFNITPGPGDAAGEVLFEVRFRPL